MRNSSLLFVERSHVLVVEVGNNAKLWASIQINGLIITILDSTFGLYMVSQSVSAMCKNSPSGLTFPNSFIEYAYKFLKFMK